MKWDSEVKTHPCVLFCVVFSAMAHDAALESLIVGIGYEMTPSDEELCRRRRPTPTTLSISGTMKIQHKTSFYQQQQQRGGDENPPAETEDTEQKAVAKSTKLRRAFSLNSYRNPFLRSPKPPEGGGGGEGATTGSESKRRVSWRKFLSKISALQFGSNLIVSWLMVVISFIRLARHADWFLIIQFVVHIEGEPLRRLPDSPERLFLINNFYSGGVTQCWIEPPPLGEPWKSSSICAIRGSLGVFI